MMFAFQIGETVRHKGDEKANTLLFIVLRRLNETQYGRDVLYSCRAYGHVGLTWYSQECIWFHENELAKIETP